MVIDIGSEAIDRASLIGSNTFVDNTNPANKTGKITSIEIWAADVSLVNCKVATFFVVSGNYLSTRDTEVIGNVPFGSKQTFPVNLDVVEGDYIGIYFESGYLELSVDGEGTWVGSPSGDYIPCENKEFIFYPAREISLHGTGVTPPVSKESARTGIYSFKTSS